MIPESIARASLSEIEEAIKPAGLQRAKARAIKELANLILEEFNGDMRKLLEMGEEKVRECLSKIPGIGHKTIDVLLANWGYPVLPVDTHIRRISKRMGLASSGGYVGIRESLHKYFRPSRRLEAHLLLIKLGRTICKSQNPRCDLCPLRRFCKYAQDRYIAVG